ncbi:hypothetical protein WG66_008891, partial [Moniliophthora roreri]
MLSSCQEVQHLKIELALPERLLAPYSIEVVGQFWNEHALMNSAVSLSSAIVVQQIETH